jgi:hypothetical protein
MQLFDIIIIRAATRVKQKTAPLNDGWLETLDS